MLAVHRPQIWISATLSIVTKSAMVHKTSLSVQRLLRTRRTAFRAFPRNTLLTKLTKSDLFINIIMSMACILVIKRSKPQLYVRTLFFPWHRVYSPNVLRNRSSVWIIQILDGVQLTQESIMLRAASGPVSNLRPF